MASPQSVDKDRIAAATLSARLKSCWSYDINWNLYPEFLRDVSFAERERERERVGLLQFCFVFCTSPLQARFNALDSTAELNDSY